MSVTAAIIARLLADSSITSVVGTRIGRDQAPSEWSGQLPYIVVHGENANYQFHSQGIARPTESQLDIEIFADDAVKRASLHEAIVNEVGTFNSNTWTAKGVFVQRLFVSGENFDTSPESAGNNHRHYRCIINCTVWWSKAE